MHPYSQFDKQRKKKKTSRTSICNPNFLHDFMKLFLTTKERKKERTAFFQKCIRRWRSFLRYFTPLKRFRFVALVVLRSALSFREGWFQRGKRKERNKRKYTCNAVLRAKGRRKIVPPTLLVEDNLLDSRRQPSSSFDRI